MSDAEKVTALRDALEVLIAVCVPLSGDSGVTTSPSRAVELQRAIAEAKCALELTAPDADDRAIGRR
jgi:hypothetical protein